MSGILRPPRVPPFERILAFGIFGSGKTYAWLKMAAWAHKTKSPARFFVIDTDAAVERMLWSEEFQSIADRVIVRPVFAWPEYVAALDEFLAQATENDWIVVDMIGNAWDAVQSYFVDEVFGKDIGQYFLEVRKARGDKRNLSPFEGWKDWCVDTETEILTKRGWLRYDQLKVGDEALVLSSEPYGSMWEPILNVYIGPRRTRKMLQLEGASHSSLTTVDHRWLVESQRRGSYKLVWKTSETLTASERIPMSAPRLDAPCNPVYPDSLVELVAWYWNEGWRTERDRPSLQGGIGQKDPKNANRVRDALTRLYGESGWSEFTRKDGVTVFRLNAAVMDDLERVAPGKVPSYSFLMDLSEQQLKTFIEICMQADGSAKQSGQMTWYQNNYESVSRFEFACALAGIPTRTWKREKKNRFGTPEYYEVSLLKSKHAWPVGAARHSEYTHTGRAKAEWVEHDGIVWCPTTPSGTWLAKRRGTVYFTGNSVINKLYLTWAAKLIYQARCHVFATSQEDRVSEEDEKAIQTLYGGLGFKPKGQKNLGHMFHTVLRFHYAKPGDWRLTSVKDRQRALLDAEPVKDWVMTYLVKVAAWKL